MNDTKEIEKELKRDIPKIIEKIKVEKSDDIFLTVLSCVNAKGKEAINKSVYQFAQIINILDNEIEYTNKFNDYNIKVVRYIKQKGK